MDPTDAAAREEAEAMEGPTGMADRHQRLRLLEALLFAAAEPLDEATLAERMPDDADLPALLEELAGLYANRGVRLVRVGDSWAFRTAPDLAPFLRIESSVSRKLSQAAVETLAVIAYHQPVTRAEIEEIRGKALSRGTLDALLEAGWIRLKGRRRSPGRPMTWGTTESFLDHFGLESLDDLPGIEELKATGLLDARPAIAAYGGLTGGEGDDAEPTADGSGDDAGPGAEGDQAPDREGPADVVEPRLVGDADATGHDD